MSPSHNRMVIDRLTATRLAELCEAFRLGVVRGGEIVDELGRCKRGSLEGILVELKRDSLKDLCRVLGLDAAGRQKALLVTRILAHLQGAQTQSELSRMGDGGRSDVDAITAYETNTAPRAKVQRTAAMDANGRSVQGSEISQYARHALARLRAEAVDKSHEFHLLALLFYKRLCDLQGESDTLATSVDRSRRLVPKGATLADVLRRPGDLGAVLDSNLRAIEVCNPGLQGVFQEASFSDKSRIPEALLRHLLERLELCRLGSREVEAATLGAEVEALIEAHYDGMRLRIHGEYFTPRGVAELIVNLVEPRRGDTIYDPTCGSGELVLQAARSSAQAGIDAHEITLIGEERNSNRWAMARVLFAIHATENVSIARMNPLEAPRLLDRGLLPTLPRYDVVIGNPPFSVGAWGYDVWSKGDRFGRDVYGCPPRAFGEFAFVQHMLASLQRSGRMAVVVPYGVLFRGGAEAKIREGLLQADVLEAVVGLGPRLFSGTSVAVAVLFFRPAKPRDRKGKVLFVDGTNEFVRDGPRNVLAREHVDHLIDAVRRFDHEPGFCRVVEWAELRERNFDLSVGSYVEHDMPLARLDLRVEADRLATLVTENAAAGAAIHVAGLQPTPAAIAALDEEIRAIRAVLGQQRRIRRLRAYQLLTRGNAGVGQRNNEVVELPIGWGLCEVGKMLAEMPRCGVSKPKSALGAGVAYLGQMALSVDGDVNCELHRRIRLERSELDRAALILGDVLVVRVHAKREGCGRAASVSRLVEPTVFESSLMRLQPNLVEIESRIFLHWLCHPPIRHLLTSRAVGSVQMYIRQEDILTLPCPVIRRDEQVLIARELQGLDEAVAREVRQLTQAEERRARFSRELT